MQTFLLHELNYVVFDLETTGLYPEQGDEIIEIGAVMIENGVVSDKIFHSLVNPGRMIPANATAVHGIRDSDVAKAPPISDIIHKFLEFTGTSVWVAQNAKFDLGFIAHKMKHLQLPLRQSVVVDTIGISKILFPYETSHSLDVLMARLGIARTGERHRSIDDSRYTAQVLLDFIKLLRQQGIHSLPEIESSFVRAENLIKVEKPKMRSLFAR